MCVFPFVQHKDNPTQIPIGIPYAFMSSSVKLGSLPEKLYNPAKGILLESKVKRKLNKYIKNHEGPVDAGDISTLSDNIQSNFSNIGDLITAIGYVAGFSFEIGGCSIGAWDEYEKKIPLIQRNLIQKLLSVQRMERFIITPTERRMATAGRAKRLS